MQTQSMTPRELLTRSVEEGLRAGATGTELLELIIREGWQPGPARDPHSDHLDGKLSSGRRVPIEIRHGARRAL